MGHHLKKLGYPILVISFVFGNFNFVKGESLNLNPGTSLDLNPLEAVNKAGVGVNIDAGDVLDAFKINFPFNLNNINIDTNTPLSPKFNTSQETLPNIDLKQFLIPKDISSNDLVGAVKAIAALVINILIVVMSVVMQILKLILGFLR